MRINAQVSHAAEKLPIFLLPPSNLQATVPHDGKSASSLPTAHGRMTGNTRTTILHLVGGNLLNTFVHEDIWKGSAPTPHPTFFFSLSLPGPVMYMYLCFTLVCNVLIELLVYWENAFKKVFEFSSFGGGFCNPQFLIRLCNLHISLSVVMHEYWILPWSRWTSCSVTSCFGPFSLSHPWRLEPHFALQMSPVWVWRLDWIDKTGRWTHVRVVVDVVVVVLVSVSIFKCLD